MTAKIRTIGTEATIDNYKWTSKDKALEGALNAMLSPYGPLGSDPNPDYTAAQEAVKALGGEVIEFTESEFDPEAVY